MSKASAREVHQWSLSETELKLGKDDESTPVLRPLRFLGLGLFIAWLCCTHIDAIYLGDASFYCSFVDTGMRFGDIGCFLIMAIAARRIGTLSRHRGVCALLLTITMVGTAFNGLVMPELGLPVGVVIIIPVLTALGGAVLFCLWAEIFCQMGTTSMVVYGGGSCVAAFAAYALVSMMAQPYAVLATALLPMLSFLCAQKSFNLVPKEKTRTATINYPIPWKIILIMGIAGAMSGFTGTILGDFTSLGAEHRIWATMLVGILLQYIVLKSPRMFDMRLMTRVCLAAAIIALFLLPLSNIGLATVVSFMMKFAYVWFTVFVIAMLANLAYRFDLPSLRLFASARACSEGGILLGVLMRDAVKNSSIVLDVTTLSIAAAVGLLVVGICVLIWRSEGAVNADWGAVGISLESGEHVVGPREQLILRCEQLAQEYGLTERETEMLQLIGKGKTRSQIEQELFLSQNTVKTHIRHLYAKLDVHSKEEVYELIGIES